ncbi:hypothetical protein JKP88DRAFT_275711 [Tribonema minus]|uniref:Uncharacterized protein n=1 Tax=Tribonema minus TaxID=303371 RepID=A0A835ZBU1_9STRA|nr:hypothetical protein JKP88DRAFT_275711 [Tribonema minus]
MPFKGWLVHDIQKIRWGTDPDPKAPELMGTETLRRSCPAELLPQSFSLIYAYRTVDFTAQDIEQAHWIVDGLQARYGYPRHATALERHAAAMPKHLE